MYAHQVIEDLGKDKINLPWADLEKYKAHIKNCCLKIKTKAIKFSLNIIDKNNFFTDINSNRMTFSGDPSQYFLPYDFFYLDFMSNGSKFAILAEATDNEENLFICHCFSCLKPNDIWEMNPLLLNIDIGGKITPHKLIENLDTKRKNYYPQRIITMTDKTLRLLNCKNITTQDNKPPEKLNKKRKKSGKQELFTYKTLAIKPTGKKQESQQAQGLWDNRVHLCRGHFKEYTAEKPLFGRIAGRVWWQPSVRGNAKEGVVMKDYKVEV